MSPLPNEQLAWLKGSVRPDGAEGVGVGRGAMVTGGVEVAGESPPPQDRVMTEGTATARRAAAVVRNRK
jgi:hypothetical protein